MFSTERLLIADYQGHNIPNMYCRRPRPADRLAVFFPGNGYTNDGPVLYYPRLVLWHYGCDLVTVDYRYHDNEAFQKAGEKMQERWFQHDVLAAFDVVAKLGGYRQRVFIGKSMGTTAFLQILKQREVAKQDVFIWLTPGKTAAQSLQLLHSFQHRSLVIAGTADPFYKADLLKQASANPLITVKIYDGADHSLISEGDPLKSASYAERLLADVDGFLASFWDRNMGS